MFLLFQIWLNLILYSCFARSKKFDLGPQKCVFLFKKKWCDMYQNQVCMVSSKTKNSLYRQNYSLYCFKICTYPSQWHNLRKYIKSLNDCYVPPWWRPPSTPTHHRWQRPPQRAGLVSQGVRQWSHQTEMLGNGIILLDNSPNLLQEIYFPPKFQNWKA